MQLEPTVDAAAGHEQPARFGRAEELTGVRAIGQRVGETRVDPRHDRRRGQDVDHLRCLVRQHLVQHVVPHEHVVVVTGPRCKRLRSPRPRGEGRQLQARGPAVSAFARPPRCAPRTEPGTAGSSARPPRPVRTATRRSGSRRAGRATSSDRWAAFGSRREISTRWSQPGWLRTKCDTDSSTKSSTSTRWKSSMTSTAGGRILGLQISDQLVHRVGPAAGQSQHRRGAVAASRRQRRPGRRSPTDQNWTPSRSVSSSDNQAVGVEDSAIHPATSDVFPVPAGATTSVSGLLTTSSNRSSRRERRT